MTDTYVADFSCSAWLPRFREKHGRDPQTWEEHDAFMDAENFHDFHGRYPKTQEELAAFKDAKNEEYGRECLQNLRNGMAKCEAKWKADGKVFAWFRPEPTWDPDCECVTPYWDFENRPKGPCRIIRRFSLIGGGQVSTTEDWEWQRPWEGKKRSPWETWRDDRTILGCTYEHDLIVKAHTADGLKQYRGVIDGYTSDMSAHAGVFDRRVPQDIVDRVARTLGAITHEDPYYALLDSSEGCAFCQRPLRDEVSKLVGVGPTCAKEHNIPHSIEAANRRLELRRKILGEIEALKH